MNAQGPAHRFGVTLFDLSLFIGLLILGYWNLWIAWDSYAPGHDAHLVIDSVTVAVATAMLLFRRRAPLVVFVVVNAALFGPDLLVSTGPVFWGEWVPSLVAAYSVAAYRGGWWSGAPMVAALSSFIVFYWRYPSGFASITSALTWVAAAAIAVGAGHGIKQMRTRSAVLAQRAETLERLQEEQAERAVADERARIARELHDVIAHNVSIMVVQASAAESTLDAEHPAALRAMRNVQAAGREALEEMGLLLGILRDNGPAGVRTPVPSLRRLDALIEPLRQSGMTITVDASGTEHRISPSVDVSAYRVLQEALTNTLKHAPGSEVFVAVEVTPARVRLTVRNHGGPANSSRQGHGLLGLGERVALHGGRLDAARQPDGDFVLQAELPMSAAVAP
jgi:signal transduction histidine kinase